MMKLLVLSTAVSLMFCFVVVVIPSGLQAEVCVNDATETKETSPENNVPDDKETAPENNVPDDKETAPENNVPDDKETAPENNVPYGKEDTKKIQSSKIEKSKLVGLAVIGVFALLAVIIVVSCPIPERHINRDETDEFEMVQFDDCLWFPVRKQRRIHNE